MIQSWLRSGITYRCSLCLCLLSLWVLSAQPARCQSQESPQAEMVVSPEPGWPQWGGPRRDHWCLEQGLSPAWPIEGPRKIWQATNLGQGYSSPVISRNRIYLTGEVNDNLCVWALDLEGRMLWSATNGAAWKGPYPGARACGALGDGRLFHLNAHGRLACFDAASGQERWAVNVLEKFEGENLTWALGECLLVDGSRVIVTPGGKKALMAALDVNQGQTIWTSPPLRCYPSADATAEQLDASQEGFDSAGYASPILFTFRGRRLIANCSWRHLFCVDADTGELLWKQPLVTRYKVIAITPVLYRDAVFATAPDSEGGKLWRLFMDGPRVAVSRLWTTPLDTCHGGVVVVDNMLVGPWYRAEKGWASVDAATGEVRHHLKDLAMGSVLKADGRLYCLSQEGEMALVQLSTEGFTIKSRFRLTPKKVNDAWAHPVILDKKLYLRYHETLYCYDIDGHN